MWWVVPFGLLLGLGAVAALVWSTEFLQGLPRDITRVGMPLILLAAFVARPHLRALGRRLLRRLLARPRHEPTHLDLNA